MVSVTIAAHSWLSSKTTISAGKAVIARKGGEIYFISMFYSTLLLYTVLFRITYNVKLYQICTVYALSLIHI